MSHAGNDLSYLPESDGPKLMFYEIFNYTYFPLLTACCIASLFAWRRCRPVFRLLGVFLLLTLAVELAARWMLHHFGQNNAVYIFYDILNIGVSSFILIKFMEMPRNKTITFITGIALIVIYLTDVLLLGRYIKDYSLINCTLSIYFCFACGLYLLDQMENPKEGSLLQRPAFLYSLISLFYYSVSLLYWIVFFRFRSEDAKSLVSITYRTFLLCNLIFYAGILFVIILEARTNSKRRESRYA